MIATCLSGDVILKTVMYARGIRSVAEKLNQDICRECPTDEELFEELLRLEIRRRQLAQLALERGIGFIE